MNTINLTPGYPLWYHDPNLEQFVRPRACTVIGAGAGLDKVNVLVFADAVLDSKKAPLFQRRSVKVLSVYPATWPAEPFCVLPQFAMDQLSENPAGAPHGGVRPKPLCGVVTIVEGFANPAPAAPPVATTPLQPKAPEVDQHGRYTGPPQIIKTNGTVQTIAPVEPTPASTEPLGPIMKRLHQAPPFMRALEGIEHKVVTRAEEFTLQTPKGVDVVKFSHNGRGFTMSVMGKTGQWVQEREGIDKAPAVTEAGNRAANLLRTAAKPPAAPKAPKTKPAAPAKPAKAKAAK